MTYDQNPYRRLEELSRSDYKILDSEPNIIGWNVRNENNYYLGEVKELLFDPKTRDVRYLIIDLRNNDDEDDKYVMVPIGIAQVHIYNDEVILPNISIDQLTALPAYIKGEVMPETEVMIRSVISPEDTRTEENRGNFDQDTFYAHQHFNRDNLYQRNR